MYAGMMQYDGDTKIPKLFLVTPPAINRTLGEFLARAGIRQLAISETQKFGHVTYFSTVTGPASSMIAWRITWKSLPICAV